MNEQRPQRSARSAAARAAREQARLPRKRAKRTWLGPFNPRVVIITFIVVLFTVPAASMWHGYQVRRNVRLLLSAATQAEADERWRDAENFLRTYLRVGEESRDIEVRLARAVQKGARSLSERARAIGYYTVLVEKYPDDRDLRLELGELQVLTAPKDARKQADLLLEKDSSDAKALRLKALAMHHELTGAGETDAAVIETSKVLGDALGHDPGDKELAFKLSDMYRKYTQKLAQSRNVPPKEIEERADAVVDTMVRRQPNDVAAHMLRYAYRRQHRLTGAPSEDRVDEDLAAVLKIDPNNTEARLAAVETLLLPLASRDPVADVEAGGIIDRARLAEAERLLLAAAQSAPRDPRPRHGLAEVYWQLGDQVKAVENLELAISLDPTKDPIRRLRLCVFLMATKRWDAADEVLEQVETSLPDIRRNVLDEEQMQHLTALVYCVRASWLIDVEPPRRNYVRAADLLSQAARVGRDDKLSAGALNYLGRCYVALRQWDKAAEIYRRAAAITPRAAPARLLAAQSLANAGQYVESVREYQATLQLLTRDTDKTARLRALAGMAQAEQSRQLALPVGQRDFRALGDIIARVKAEDPESPTALLLEVRAQLATGEKPRRDAAMASLEQASSRFATLPEYWRLAADTYLSIGDIPQAEKGIARLETLAGKPEPILQAKLALAKGDMVKADEIVSKVDPAQVPAEILSALRAELAITGGNVAQAQVILEKQAADDPRNPEPVFRLAQLALTAGEESTYTRWQRELVEREGPNGTLWRYCEIDHLLRQSMRGDRSALAKANDLAAELTSLRPNWSATQAAAAYIAEAQGRFDDAINHYQSAYRLGDNRPALSQRLIGVLLARGRAEEARKHLDDLPKGRLLNPEMLPFVVQVGVASRNPKQAADLVREAIRLNPLNGEPYCLLGQVLLAADDAASRAEAYEALRRAVTVAPGDLRGWLALAYYHAMVDHPDRAIDVFTAARAAGELLWDPDHKIAPATESVVFGIAFMLGGDLRSADTYFRVALRLAPDDPLVRRIWSRGFFTLDFRESAGELGSITLKGASPGVTIASALALIAAGGPEQEKIWTEQLRTTPRWQAIAALLHGGPESLRRARGLLFQLPTNELRRGDYVLFARINALLGETDAAWKVYQLATQQPNASLANEMAEFARTNKIAGADQILQSLWDRLSPKDREECGIRTLALLPSNANQKPVNLAQSYVDRPDPGDKQGLARLQRCVECADWLVKVAAFPDAAEFLKRNLKGFPQSEIVRADWLSRFPDGYTEALTLALHAGEVNPSARTAGFLARVLARGTPQPAQVEKAEGIFGKVLADPSDKPAAFFVELSVLREYQDKIDEAERLAERARTIDPRNIAAWNNVAWFETAYRSNHARAITAISRAMRMAGPAAELCDTKGVALAGAGRADDAVRLLEANVLRGGASPYGLLHLAESYHALGRVAEARVIRDLIDPRDVRTFTPRDKKAFEQLTGGASP